MSKRANPTVVGVFVIGAVILAVALTMVLGSGRLFRSTTRYVLFFEGSVKGLEVGSPVMFRGVPIGSVTDVRMQIDPETLEAEIPVFIEVDPSRIGTPVGKTVRHGNTEDVRQMIQKGLRAQLESQSIVTGKLLIQFDFHPDAPLELVGTDMGVTELPTIPTPLEKISKALQELDLSDLAEKLSVTLEQIREVLGSPAMARGIQAVPAILEQTEGLVRDLRQDITPVLREAGAALRDTRSLVQNLDRGTGTLGREVHGTVRDSRTLVQTVTAQVEPLADNAGRLLADGDSLLNSADQSLQTLNRALENSVSLLDEALAQVAVSLRRVDESLEATPQLRHELTVTLREVGAAARSVRVLGELLQQRPDAVLRGKKLGGER